VSAGRGGPVQQPRGAPAGRRGSKARLARLWRGRRSLHRAALPAALARLLLQRSGRRLGVEEAWQLASHGLVRKYLGALELLLAPRLAPRGAVVARGGSLRRALAAMAAHASQWVW
jgi:hypothetical protein